MVLDHGAISHHHDLDPVLLGLWGPGLQIGFGRVVVAGSSEVEHVVGVTTFILVMVRGGAAD